MNKKSVGSIEAAEKLVKVDKIESAPVVDP